MQAPFPLKSVLPIMVRATGWLKTREDREDAIQDAFEEILKYGGRLTNQSENDVQKLVRRIAFTEACQIYRKNQRQIKYWNIYKSFDSVQDRDSQGRSSCVNYRRSDNLKEEIEYRKDRGRHLFSKLDNLTRNQRALILLLMMGCTYREANWIVGYGDQGGGTDIRRARKAFLRQLEPELIQELEDEYRGQPEFTFKDKTHTNRHRRLFYVASDGVHRYARPGSRAYNFYQKYKARDAYTVGRLMNEDSSN